LPLLLKAHANADVKPGVNGILLFQNLRRKVGGKEGICMMFTYTNALLIAEKRV
jgi:hypothetical protein